MRFFRWNGDQIPLISIGAMDLALIEGLKCTTFGSYNQSDKDEVKLFIVTLIMGPKYNNKRKEIAF